MTMAPPAAATRTQQPQPRPPGRSQSAWAGSFIAPAAAGLATVCASTALTGVIKGSSWLGYIFVAVLLIACTGLALRSLRAPALVVGLAQLAVLLFLVTGMFTSSGILAVIPGPAAFGELGDVLAAAGADIRTGLPPVDASAAILCLSTIGIGLVAIIVDTLAVAIAAPAAAGLVLLCLYAVPASLADEMLPWWSFAIGAAAFAALIAVDGNHRHRQWRGRGTAPDRSPGAVSPSAAVVGAALVLGLLAGATFTAIGTVGQLPFMQNGTSRAFSGGLGLQPFTELRGLLNDQGSSEIFRVHNLSNDKRLLRAFTLDKFEPDKGWKMEDETMPPGAPADGTLPRTDGDLGGPTRSIRIDPINWRDVWLPFYGLPRKVDGLDDGWYYDQISGAIFSEKPRRPGSYTLTSSLRQPTMGQLREAVPDDSKVPPIYTEVAKLHPEVDALTERIVQGKSGRFDQAMAIWEHFISDGGFVYDTETAAESDKDALADFLLKGKRGFCAQFASSMAVMLRSLDIPARVAIGFTSGTNLNGYRSIGTRDAHAWVEVYFGEQYGWVSFDPTPLDGGRGFVPPYLDEKQDNQAGDPSASNTRPEETSTAPSRTRPPEGVEPGGPDADSDRGATLAQAPGWARWSTVFVMLLAAGTTAFGVLVARRTSQLRGRLRGGPDQAEVRLSSAGRWLPMAAAGGWLLSLGLLGWMVSWWLALLLMLVAGVLVTPVLVREVNRSRRLHDITLSRPSAPEAAWRELLDECADRGKPISEADTVRETARRLATEYHLDEDGRRHLRTVVAALERSWYSTDAAVDEEFAAAFEGLRQSLHRGSPLPLRGRLLPTSVLKR